MNPLRWIRWKVLAGFLVLFGLVYFVGVDGFLLRRINLAGETAPTARWRIADLALGLVVGDLKLGDILLATPHAEARSSGAPGRETDRSPDSDGEQVFHAQRIEVNTSVNELLRGRYVVDEVNVHVPRLVIQRRADGTTNVGEIGRSSDDEPETSPRTDTDWVAVIEEWWGRIKKWRQRRPTGDDESDEEIPGTLESEKSRGFADYTRRVYYPFAGRPDILLRKAVVDGLEVAFEDAGDATPLPRLTDGIVVLEEFSNKPWVQERPSLFSLRGAIAGARLELKGVCDFTGDEAHFELDVRVDDLPVSVVEAFLGRSLPVELTRGSIDLTSCVVLGESSLLVSPRLEFADVALAAKDRNGRIAGFLAPEFVQAFNEASDALDTIVIADLKITGTMDHPRFEWGDSVKELVVAGGKAFAKKQIDTGLGKGRELLKGKLDEIGVDLPVSDDFKERLKDAGKVLDTIDPFKASPFGKKKDEESR